MKQQTIYPFSLIFKRLKNVVKNIIKKTHALYSILLYPKLHKIGTLTIVANNCIAGFLYQKYGMKYYSPTIGLQFPQEDFVKFCSNFEYYISCDLEESSDKRQNTFTSLGGGDINFPVGKIDDITIFFQHYNDFNDAKIKWESRKKRINYNKLFFIFVAYNNTPTEILKSFEELPIKNKIIITNEERYECSIAFALHNGLKPWYDEMNKGLFVKKYYEQYNFYKWFIKNNGVRANGI
ncbi:hypothetical protein AGMMS50212_09860 [Spirochaetia bacterium]|nr:hypothetical protein AGMMS50212_09860 [Spirochaetia bacterium]